MGIHSDPSDSEESDDDDIQGTSNAQPIEIYNPKDFEDLEVSTEMKELFQNIMRYRRSRLLNPSIFYCLLKVLLSTAKYLVYHSILL